MNEPKRRGRSPKLIALPVIAAMEQAILEQVHPDTYGVIAPSADGHAQAYALRVWHGQSESAPREWREWRVQRVREALAGQLLPFDGVTLP